MSQATHLYFDHPQEPDPEERGLYWATRFTDAYKTFGFLPDSLYDNIVEERSGKPLTKADVCGADMAKCDRLKRPENIIGEYCCVILLTYSTLDAFAKTVDLV